MDNERLNRIKQYTIVNKEKQGDRYIIQKEDLHLLIEEVERLQEENEVLKSYLQFLNDHFKRSSKAIENLFLE